MAVGPPTESTSSIVAAVPKTWYVPNWSKPNCCAAQTWLYSSAELDRVAALDPGGVGRELAAPVALDVLAEEAHGADVADRPRQQRHPRVGVARPLSRDTGRALQQQIGAQRRRVLADDRVGAVPLGAVVGDGADRRVRERVAGGVGVERFVVAEAVADREAAAALHLVVDAAEDRFGVVGRIERLLEAPKKLYASALSAVGVMPVSANTTLRVFFSRCISPATK